MQALKASYEQVDEPRWAEREFATFDPKDKRLKKRIIKMAQAFAAAPQANIPEACGQWKATKAAYRCMSNPKISDGLILEAHRHATLERLRGERVVLVPQDTTHLNFSTHPQTTGLGPIGGNQDKPMGLLLHGALALDEGGQPLGLLHANIYAREAAEVKKAKGSHNRQRLEEKESFKWLRAYEATCQAARETGAQTTFVSIADREGDIYELFLEAARQGHAAHLIVRAQHPRSVLQSREKTLWEWLGAEAAAPNLLAIELPAKGGRAARTALLSIRFAPVTLQVPIDRAKYQKHTQTLQLWAVEAREQFPPEGTEPLCWRLLTTLEVRSFEDAVRVVRWYGRRWQIEVFHKILKSGCRTEERQLERAERLRCTLALDLVVAWRIFALSWIGRKTPNCPATVIFTPAEWKALYCFIHKSSRPPEEVPTLGEAMRWVGMLGGFLARKSDGDPGPIVLWRGMTRLADITAAWVLFNGQKDVGNG